MLPQFFLQPHLYPEHEVLGSGTVLGSAPGTPSVAGKALALNELSKNKNIWELSAELSAQHKPKHSPRAATEKEIHSAPAESSTGPKEPTPNTPEQGQGTQTLLRPRCLAGLVCRVEPFASNRAQKYKKKKFSTPLRALILKGI